MRCRLCADQCKNNPTSLFENGHKTELNKLIAKYLSIEVKQHDSYSTRVCLDCVQHMEVFHNFYCLIEEKQNLIRNEIMTMVTIKNEPPDDSGVFIANDPFEESSFNDQVQSDPFANISDHISANEMAHNSLSQQSTDTNPNSENSNSNLFVKEEILSDDEDEMDLLEDPDYIVPNEAVDKKFREQISDGHSNNSLNCRMCGSVAKSFEDAKDHLHIQHNVAYRRISVSQKAAKENALLVAAQEVLIKNKTYRTTAQKFDLDLSLLKRCCKKLEEEFKDISTVPENKLLKCLLKCLLFEKKKSPSKMPNKLIASNFLDYNSMMKAVKDVLIQKEGIRPTARKYQLDRSTLSRYTIKLAKNFDDFQHTPDEDILKAIRQCHTHVPTNQVFSIDEEQGIIDYIFECAKENQNFSCKELKLLAYQLSAELGKCPDQWIKTGIASVSWYRGFMSRHIELKEKQRRIVIAVPINFDEYKIAVGSVHSTSCATTASNFTCNKVASILHAIHSKQTRKLEKFPPL